MEFLFDEIREDKGLYGLTARITTTVRSIDGKPPKEYFRKLILELAKEEAEMLRKKLANNSQSETAVNIIPVEEKGLGLPLLTDAQIIKCKFHDIDPDRYLCYVVVKDLVMDDTRSGPLYVKGDLFFKTADLWNDNAPIFKWMDRTGHIHERNIKPKEIEVFLEEGNIVEYSPVKEWNPNWDKADPSVTKMYDERRELDKSPDAT